MGMVMGRCGREYGIRNTGIGTRDYTAPKLSIPVVGVVRKKCFVLRAPVEDRTVTRNVTQGIRSYPILPYPIIFRLIPRHLLD